MTVAELIEKLREMPGEMPVYTLFDNCDCEAPDPRERDVLVMGESAWIPYSGPEADPDGVKRKKAVIL